MLCAVMQLWQRQACFQVHDDDGGDDNDDDKMSSINIKVLYILQTNNILSLYTLT